jgi:hypothetical protein
VSIPGPRSDCRVGELLELPRHVKAKHLRGFHVD